jgi:hypothetical protein
MILRLLLHIPFIFIITSESRHKDFTHHTYWILVVSAESYMLELFLNFFLYLLNLAFVFLSCHFNFSTPSHHSASFANFPTFPIVYTRARERFITIFYEISYKCITDRYDHRREHEFYISISRYPTHCPRIEANFVLVRCTMTFFLSNLAHTTWFVQHIKKSLVLWSLYEDKCNVIIGIWIIL